MRLRTCPLCGGQHADDVFCIRFIADRVKELESKLGAAELAATASAERSQKGHTPTPPAAPSVSADYWSHLAARWEHAISCVDVGMDIPARYAVDEAKKLASAYRLAAAVTGWWEDTKGPALLKHEQIERIASAFVRGEPLPGKANG